jgi:hypothetical protein
VKIIDLARQGGEYGLPLQRDRRILASSYKHPGADSPSPLNPARKKSMARIVVNNTSPGAQQRLLEAQVQVAFAKVASSVLTFLAGRQAEHSLIKAMQHFITVHEAAKTKSIDPKGTAIRVPKLDHADNDENEHINAILRGSLSMVAAMLESNAKVPLDNRGGQKATKTEKRDYNKALKEIADGIALMQARIDEATS